MGGKENSAVLPAVQGKQTKRGGESCYEIISQQIISNYRLIKRETDAEAWIDFLIYCLQIIIIIIFLFKTKSFEATAMTQLLKKNYS